MDFYHRLPSCILLVVIVILIMKVGDGTTTVVLLAAEFLREAKPFIEDGVHSQNLIRSYRTACSLVWNSIFLPPSELCVEFWY